MNMVQDAKNVKSICPICGQGCFADVKVKDNKPVTILPLKGSPHPADCPRAGQARDYHDHPMRLNYPMKRVGKRGEGKWERISWDQAMDEISAKLAKIRDKYGPEAVQCMGGSSKGPADAVCWRWANLWGTPNILFQGKNCGEAPFLAEWATYGNMSDMWGALPEQGHTMCCIMWGSNPITRIGNKALRSIDEMKSRGGKLIVVDPKRTELAEMADIWLQVRPGTDGALAYGMLNVIIREKLYDADFVAKWCLGFDELCKVMEKYTPEKVAEITWIPAEKIIEAARTYATLKPGLIPFGLGYVESGRSTTSAVFGLAYLRAITGNLDVKGGQRLGDHPKQSNLRKELHWDTLLNHPLRTKDNVSSHLFPVASVKGMKTFRDAMSKLNPQGVGPALYMMVTSPLNTWNAIIDADPYPIRGLIAQGGNVLVALTNSRRIYDALKSDNLDVFVSMEHFMTPVSALADYVLPATDALERPFLGNTWGFCDTYEAAAQALQPKYERHDDYALWKDLGNRLGQKGMWPDTLEGWFDKVLEPTGMTHAQLSAQEMPWLFGTPEYLRHEKEGFATFSGKVELTSSLMVKLGYPAIPEYDEPSWSPMRTPELSKEFPLVLTTGSGVKWYYRSQHRQLAKMRKQHDYARVTMHPDTAAELNVTQDQLVWVETPQGRVKQMVEVSDEFRPGVVHADAFWWFPERKAEDPHLFGVWEANINAILPERAEDLDYAGDSYMRGLICKVYAVSNNEFETEDERAAAAS
jgi:anaerobic selenocysteine-containing dehydrogenase